MFEGVPLTWFLIVATIMFFIGIYGFLVRKNLITILMSLELVLNSVNINFVAFNKLFVPPAPGRYVLHHICDCCCRC